MRTVPPPDLRPLQQPLDGARLREARRRLRAERQAADVPGAGLAIAGWVLLLPGALVLVAGLAAHDADPAMPVVGGLLAAVGAALLVWRGVRRRDAVRRAARLQAFADANRLAYAQRALLGPKAAPALRRGFGHVAVDVLRAPDGAEWGVWAARLPERGGQESRIGFVELPLRPEGLPERVLAGLIDDLRSAPLPLRVELAGGRLAVTAERAWAVDDPAVQSLVHRIRSWAAAGTASPTEPSGAMPAAIASTPAGRRGARAALASGALIALAAIGAAFLQAVLRAAAP
ncbi:hypothetical protein [Agrococcus terreus]|uniref:Uncharacterized protein n=1 Tax=Agrococcus terreus TaxID=574649 RepID=A0ABQ2KN33_9MICO|nr:hypothetical protein [Agrococcus terreus]GGN86347.1 hypothetical protein GCM10010968_19900 [Agrococcus terreus]